jgi:ParB-like chromosome segregation protein Spo0J
MSWSDIELNKLKKAPWNYKTENEATSEKLLANIKNNGQIENLIVRELDYNFYEVVNGNHRLDILIKLNYEKAVCFNLGKISEILAKKIAIETNETRFDSNISKLAEIIDDLKNEYPELEETLPFTKLDLTNLDNIYNYSEDVYNLEDDEYEEETEENNSTHSKELDIMLAFNSEEEAFEAFEVLSKKYKKIRII